MHQLTLRIDDDLAEDLKAVAAVEGKSLNAYASGVLRAAVDPSLAGSEAERVRERLARAGLLAEPGRPRRAPDPTAVARARREAGRGRPLSDYVSEGRG